MRRKKMYKQIVIAVAVLGAAAAVAFTVHDEGPFELDEVGEVATMVAEATLSGSTALADTVEDGCMQDLAMFNLNCTANDVQIATARVEEISDPCEFPGDTVTFTAEFDVVVTAKERFDLGLYFAIDGDGNGDGAISGMCSVSNIDPESVNADGLSQFVDLDDFPDTGDSCGDITKKRNPLQPLITITTFCIDTDGDGFLNLPNCTSWRQSGANELCESPLQAFPGSPSKCRCDPTFQVEVPVPPATLLVDKTASPTSVDEPGGPIVFTVTVTNTGVDPDNPVTLDSLIDDVHGNLNGQGDCSVPQPLAGNGGFYTCSFTAVVDGDAGDFETDTVTASGLDSRTPPNPVRGSDDATVTIDDVQPTIAVVKLANGEESTTVPEPGADVTFSVAVTNNSVSTDPVTINSLTDDIHGDLNGQGDCSVPQTIQPGDTYNCSFVAFVGTNYLDSETDTVTASGVDDDNNPVSASDAATVMVTNVPSMITLLKTVSSDNVDEPGGPVTYTYKVTNTSPVDTVTIDTLTDDKLGPLGGQGDCLVPQVLAPGGMYSCSVSADVVGNAGDALTNTGTASGVDDDGVPVTAMDNAVVNFNNVPPAASLTKTATELLVTYAVEVCNDSDAESLTLDVLNDDIYGDITNVANPAIAETTCVVSQTLAPVGEADNCYSCTFKAATTTSPTTDTVTGTVNDDDGSMPTTPNDSATVTFD